MAKSLNKNEFHHTYIMLEAKPILAYDEISNFVLFNEIKRFETLPILYDSINFH